MRLSFLQYCLIVGIYLAGGIVAALNKDIDGWATATFFLVVACGIYAIWKRNYRKQKSRR